MDDFGSFLPKKLGDTEIKKWEDGFQKFCVKFGGEAGRGQKSKRLLFLTGGWSGKGQKNPYVI